jgi:hypothetical protein
LQLVSSSAQIVADRRRKTPQKRIDSRAHKSTGNKSEELPAALLLLSSSFIFSETKKMRYLGKRCEKLGVDSPLGTDKRAPIPLWNFPFEIGANSGILEIDKRSQIILELV